MSARPLPTQRPVVDRTHRIMGEPPQRRDQILDVLRNSTYPRSIVDLADALKVHPNTVRFHLDVLVRTGQVQELRAEITGPGRPPVLFRATRRMNPDGPTNYRLLAAMLTSHLATGPDPATTATDVGRRWGPTLVETDRRPSRSRIRRGEALTEVADVLAKLGFEPESPTGPRDPTIRLRHCPFLELVTDTPSAPDRNVGGPGEVICSLHLGLMQGAFAALGGPVTADRLDPFVQPDLCVAHLTAVGNDAGATKRKSLAIAPGTER